MRGSLQSKPYLQPCMLSTLHHNCTMSSRLACALRGGVRIRIPVRRTSKAGCAKEKRSAAVLACRSGPAAVPSRPAERTKGKAVAPVSRVPFEHDPIQKNTSFQNEAAKFCGLFSRRLLSVVLPGLDLGCFRVAFDRSRVSKVGSRLVEDQFRLPLYSPQLVGQSVHCPAVRAACHWTGGAHSCKNQQPSTRSRKNIARAPKAKKEPVGHVSPKTAEKVLFNPKKKWNTRANTSRILR